MITGVGPMFAIPRNESTHSIAQNGDTVGDMTTFAARRSAFLDQVFEAIRTRPSVRFAGRPEGKVLEDVMHGAELLVVESWVDVKDGRVKRGFQGDAIPREASSVASYLLHQFGPSRHDLAYLCHARHRGFDL